MMDKPCLNAVCKNKVSEAQRLCSDCLQGKVDGKSFPAAPQFELAKPNIIVEDKSKMNLDRLKKKQTEFESKRSKLLKDHNTKKNKYCVEIKPRVIKAANGDITYWVDVYDVLEAFAVTNPAAQHAIKKMLMPGKRGVKSITQDYQEAIASIQRAVEMQ